MGKQEMKRFPPPIDDFDEQTPDETALADQLAMADTSPDSTVDSMSMPEAEPPPAEVSPAQKIGGADETAVPPKAPETNSLLSEQLDNAIQDKLGERYAPTEGAGSPPPMPRGEAPGSDDARFQREGDDAKIQDARKRDDWARILRGIELGGKQLIAGVLHQDKTAELVSPDSTNYEGQARADAERGEQRRYARSQQEIAEAHRRGMSERQFRLDAAAAAERARTAGRQEKQDELKQRKDESDADFRERQLKSQEERARNHDATTREAARISAGRADSKDIEGDVQKLAKETGDTAPLIAEKLARVKSVMAKHPDDIPGVGPLDSRTPAIALSPDAQSVQSDARELVNTLLFLQSGAGVSNQERENKYRAYGVGEGGTEEAFRQGMSKLENDIAAALKSKQAGFRPGVVKTYTDRGGTSPDRIKGPLKMRFPDGSMHDVDSSEVELARQKGGVPL